jgi:MEMO1 family protein
MSSLKQLPKIRSDVQVFPAEYQGSQVFVIQDPLGLVPDSLFLTREMMQLLVMMTKSDSFLNFQRDLTLMQNGVLVSSEEIGNMVSRFDEMNLLDSQNFRSRRKSIVNEFCALETRQPFLAGRGYPADPNELDSLLESALTRIPPKPEILRRRPKVLIAPHIDINAGIHAYGRTYSHFPEETPSRIILLGTGHSLTTGFFCVTFKDYVTPIGILKTDRQAVQTILRVLGGAVAPNDFAHWKEHSIEFQSLFIMKCLNGAETIAIPILVGSFSGLLPSLEKPGDHLQLASFFNLLRDFVEDPDSLIIAGVDLSHIGYKFGHSKSAKSMADEAERHDRRLLETFVKGDIRAFWAESQETEDHYNVCGLSSMASILEISGDLEGEILDYQMLPEEATQSAVSFASCVLWEKHPL